MMTTSKILVGWMCVVTACFPCRCEGQDMSSLDLSSEQFVEMSMGAQPQDVTTLHVSSYALVVTTEPAHLPGLTRHLISVRLPDGDRVSSVFGTNLHPMNLRAPEGVFNSPYNGSWSASGMNPKFLNHAGHGRRHFCDHWTHHRGQNQWHRRGGGSHHGARSRRAGHVFHRDGRPMACRAFFVLRTAATAPVDRRSS